MLIGIPKEIKPEEKRIALTPSSVERLVKKGADIIIEEGLGCSLNYSNDDYIKSGAKVNSVAEVLSKSDIILRINKPSINNINQLKKGAIHISFLDPFNEKELIKSFSENNISAISMEMIPRTTISQKMDALSSQANLAGYVSVIIAAERINKILPMMMTPAGTIPPARIFIIGAGVAGLQAIATAKRLGARVEAFDTREVVEEQVQSLGARFIKIDLGETGQTKNGYAKALTPEQVKKQHEGMGKICAHSDIVITTAQLFGRKAPTTVTKEMINKMNPGSIIVDMAVDSGGNVEGSVPNQEVDINGVKIIGLSNLPGHVSAAASQMYSSNLTNLIETFWDQDKKVFKIDLDDDFFKACLITHGGKIVNKAITD